MNQPGRSTPLLLKLLVFKKLVEAGVLFVAALLSLVGSRHYRQLPELADRLGAGHRLVLEALARQEIGMGLWRLQITAIAAALFAVLITVASLATLRQRPWGEKMLLAVFLAMLPLEGWDLVREPSWPHGLVLALTLLGTVLVLGELRQSNRARQRPTTQESP
ncbi:MAG: DUF2127 domain-containing protein [Synechococcaceae cyanobacterium ELA263]